MSDTRALVDTTEAEAEAYARACIARMRDDRETLQQLIPGAAIATSMFDPEAGLILDKRLLMQKALRSTQDMLEVVTWARLGDRGADTAVLALADEFQNRGQPTPQLIGAYAIESRNGLIVHLRGKTKSKNVLRDIALCIVIGQVCERFGLDPTSSPERKRTGASSYRKSGCAIVSKALKSVELPHSVTKTSIRGMETIWRKWGIGLFPSLSACAN